MKVAICYTKNGREGTLVADEFARGVAECGDEPVAVTPERIGRVPRIISECDVAFQVCETYRVRHKHTSRWDQLRYAIQDTCREHAIRRLIIDSGYLRAQRELPVEERYWAISYDGIKLAGDYGELPGTPDRFERLGIECRPWRNVQEGGYVLILAETRQGVAAEGINVIDWYRTVADAVHLYGEHVVVRAHPGQYVIKNRWQREYTQLQRIEPHEIRHKTSLRADLAGAKVAVAWATNAAVETVLQGVPCYCGSPLNMAKPVSVPSIEELLGKPHHQYLHCLGRQSWLHDLAWCQWNLQEMRDGTAWGHLRRYATYHA